MPGWWAVLVPLVAMAVAGVLGGALWAWWGQWGEPAAYTVTRLGEYRTEQQLGRFFGVEVRYAVIGLLVSFLVAAALTLWLRRAGWPLVVGVLLGGLVAAGVAFGVGTALGPPDLVQALAAATAGDTVPARLDVQIPALLLAWSVGGLMGLVLVVSVTDRDRSGHAGGDVRLPELPRG